MRISAKYADRSDLNTCEKWHFTFDDWLSERPWLRAFHRRFYALPGRLKDFIVMLWFATSMFPLALGAMCMVVAEKILVDEYGDGEPDILGFGLFIASIVALIWMLPLVGWGLVVLSVQFLVGITYMKVMDDYDKELDKASKLQS